MSTRSATRFNREVGERLEHIRNVLGMSQKVVADQLGVTRQTLSNYESGRNSMSAGIVRAVCEIYCIPPSWLLGIDDELYHKATVNGRHIEIREKSPSIASPLDDVEGEES